MALMVLAWSVTIVLPIMLCAGEGEGVLGRVKLRARQLYRMAAGGSCEARAAWVRWSAGRGAPRLGAGRGARGMGRGGGEVRHAHDCISHVEARHLEDAPLAQLRHNHACAPRAILDGQGEEAPRLDAGDHLRHT